MGQFCFKFDFNLRLLETTKQHLQGLNVSWFHCERSGFVLGQLLWVWCETAGKGASIHENIQPLMFLELQATK